MAYAVLQGPYVQNAGQGVEDGEEQQKFSIYPVKGCQHGESVVIIDSDGITLQTENYVHQRYRILNQQNEQILAANFAQFQDCQQEALVILMKSQNQINKMSLLILSEGEEPQQLSVPPKFNSIIPIPKKGVILQSCHQNYPSVILSRPLEKIYSLKGKEAGQKKPLRNLLNQEILNCFEAQNHNNKQMENFLVTQSTSDCRLYIWKMIQSQDQQISQDQQQFSSYGLSSEQSSKTSIYTLTLSPLNSQEKLSSRKSRNSSSHRRKTRIRSKNLQTLSRYFSSATTLQEENCDSNVNNTTQGGNDKNLNDDQLNDGTQNQNQFVLQLETFWDFPKQQKYSKCIYYGGKFGKYLGFVNQIQQMIKIIHLGPEKEQPIEGIDAVGISINALENNSNLQIMYVRLLVLSSDQNFLLYDGTTKLCNVVLQTPELRFQSMDSEEYCRRSSTLSSITTENACVQKIVGICHAVGNRFNTLDQNQNQNRYLVQFIPVTAPAKILWWTLYVAIDNLASFEKFSDIYNNFRQQKKYEFRDDFNGKFFNSEEVEWETFTRAFRYWAFGLSGLDLQNTAKDFHSYSKYTALKCKYKWANQKNDTKQNLSSNHAIKQQTMTQEPLELTKLLLAFHYTYESCKFDVGLVNFLVQIGELSVQLAKVLGFESYLELYRRDLDNARIQPWILQVSNVQIWRKKGDVQQINMMDSLTSLMFTLKGSYQPECFPDQKVANRLRQWVPSVGRMMDIMQLYKMVAGLKSDECEEKRIVEKMALSFGWSASTLDVFPEGIALPLRQVLKHVSKQPPKQWPVRCFNLIGRQDLAANTCMDSSQLFSPLGWLDHGPANESISPSLVVSHPLSPLSPAKRATLGGVSKGSQWGKDEGVSVQERCGSMLVPYECQIYVSEGSDEGRIVTEWEKEEMIGGLALAEDGMSSVMQQQDNMRFRRDKRLQEVRQLLRSSEALILRTDSAAVDTVSRQQLLLISIAQRNLALSVGRGAFALGSKSLLPLETIQMPALQTGGQQEENGRKGAKVGLDFSQFTRMVGSDATCKDAYLLWPKFHNAVAAGLQISPSGLQISHSWVGNLPFEILDNTNNESNTEDMIKFGGMVFALGLTGRLNNASISTIVSYIVAKQDSAKIGSLLGLAAGNRGSMNQDIYKGLRLTAPTIHPQHFPEVELPCTVQTAALLGIGLLYEGTGNVSTANDLIDQIGKECQIPQIGNAGSDPNNQNQWGNLGQQSERGGYGLAAGMAVGLVMLQYGGVYTNIERRLQYLMTGAKEYGIFGNSKVTSLAPNELTLSPLDEILGVGTTANDVIRRDTFDAYTMLDDNANSNMAALANTRGSGMVPSMNIDSHQSNTSQLSLEGSLVNLDVTAPAAIIALALMYLKSNDINQAKMFSIPDTRYQLKTIKPEFILLKTMARGLVLWDSIQPSEEWVRSFLPPVIQQLPENKMEDEENMLDRMLGLAEGEDEDTIELVGQAHICAVVGALMAMGFKYAGSADQHAKKVMLDKIKFLWNTKSGLVGVPQLPSLNPCLEQAICNICVSLSVVMAGTGDLHVFKLLRSLRLRLAQIDDKDDNHPYPLNYGSHMAISMAMGFLFLGGGTRTFSTSDSAIGALLIACYPVWPNQPGDNQCHLQAFRHLYVLAAEQRMVEAIDVDTKKPDVAKILIATKNEDKCEENKYELSCPCLLPPQPELDFVELVGDHYHSQLLQGEKMMEGLQLRKKIWIKKKQGMLAFADDPTGNRSLLSRTYSNNQQNDLNKLLNKDQISLQQLCRVFKASPFVNGLAAFVDQGQRDQEKMFNYNLNIKNQPQGQCNLIQILQLKPFKSLKNSFSEFCGKIMFDCMASESMEVITLLIRMHCIVENLSQLFNQNSELNPPLLTQELQNLNIIQTFYQTDFVRGLQQSKEQLLIPEEFLAQLSFQLDTFWEKLVYQDPKILQMFLGYIKKKGQISYDGLFGCFLAYNKIPNSEQIYFGLQKSRQVLKDLGLLGSSGGADLRQPFFVQFSCFG